MASAKPPPQPAYLPTSSSSPLHADRDLYARIARTGKHRIPIQRFTIPPRSGQAWHVPQHSIIRLSTPEGPQVGDLNLWHAENIRERFWAARTRQLEKSHVGVGNRLWSCLPYMRPMVTMIADSLRETEGWVDSASGGGLHDLLGTRCDPYVNTLLTDTSYDYHCHSNLVRAVLPYGLQESDVHDVLNVFQVTLLDSQGRYCMAASPASKHSYIEFFAEIPLLCALSTCPGGDLSQWAFGQGEGDVGSDEDKSGGMKDTCRPIQVEVYSIDANVKPEVLEGWQQPKVPDYRGMHGMIVPQGEKS